MIKPVEPNIYLDDESGVFIIRKSKKGLEPLWKSTHSTSIKFARAVKDDYIREWLGSEPKRKLRFSFKSIFAETLQIKNTKSYKTGETAETVLRLHLGPWFEQKCPFLDQFNAGTWETYILDQHAINKNRRLKHDRETLIFALTLARKKGLIKEIYSLRNPDEKREVGKYFEDEDIEALIEHAPTEDLRFQILIAVKLGMRLREILHLSWDRIDLKRGIISLQPEDNKTRRKRFIPIHTDLMPLLNARRDAADSLWLFPSPIDSNRPVDTNKHAWETCRRLAKVSGRFHDLRHKAITDMLAAGIPSADVTKICGASQTVIDRIYHHLRKDVLESFRNLNCGKFVGAKIK